MNINYQMHIIFGHLGVVSFRFYINAIVDFANSLTGKMYIRCDGPLINLAHRASLSALLVLMGQVVGLTC
jgi:hypothetical protein